jgi:Holliday junction resolvasome RuvABC endonuclease subunit
MTNKNGILDAGAIISKDISLNKRFLEIYDALTPILDKFKAMGGIVVCVEQYMTRSMAGTDAVKGVIGIIRLEIARRDLEMVEIYPIQVKKIITGHGNASKEEVMEAVVREMGIVPEYYLKNDNITDAIAISIVERTRQGEKLGKIRELMKIIEDDGGILDIRKFYIVNGYGNAKAKKKIKPQIEVIIALFEYTKVHRWVYEFTLPWTPIEEVIIINE